MMELRKFTPARVGLGRAGNSVPTRELLDFQLAHARAKDAVHYSLNTRAVIAELEAAGLETVQLTSLVKDRTQYLQRPDLGRRLGPVSVSRLHSINGPFDLVLIIADGLSPLAVERRAARLCVRIASGCELTVAPVLVIEQARVAIGDEAGAILNAGLSIVLIGERPGLSSPDSLGAYLTWAPRPGRTDAERNCVSNIRPEGLSEGAAAELLLLLIGESRRRKLSGVGLSLPRLLSSSQARSGIIPAL